MIFQNMCHMFVKENIIISQYEHIITLWANNSNLQHAFNCQQCNLNYSGRTSPIYALTDQLAAITNRQSLTGNRQRAAPPS